MAVTVFEDDMREQARRWPTRPVVVSWAILVFSVGVAMTPARAGDNPFDLRQQLEREAGIIPRSGSAESGLLRSGESESPQPSGDGQASADGQVGESMISLDEEPKEELPVRLRLVRDGNRVEVVRGDTVIRVFPVSVGKPGWETPLGVFRVLQMERDPVFRNPFDPTDVRPPRSPRNPLGPAWIGFWSDGKGVGIGFHGTNLDRLQPSHGCVRMHNHDVTALYGYVSIGTVVEVVR